ncbi:MAG: response regulator [Myxococcales bacterium]|nr:response regulator [Myxococcales bacterium]
MNVEDQAERTRGLLLVHAYKNQLASVVVNLAATLGVAFVIGTKGAWWPWIWLGAVGVASALRLLSGAGFRRAFQRNTVPTGELRVRWQRRYEVGLTAGGSLWAYLTWTRLSALGLEQQFVLIVVVSALAGGATGVLAPLLRVGRLYIGLLLLPACFRLATMEHAQPVLGVLGTIFFVVMVVGHRNNHLLLEQSLVLQAQNAELVEQLQGARDTAVKASENKSRFVAMTSHELRGPLNGILGMSHALIDTRLSEHQRELVRALSTSAEALSRLLSDLLDIARIEAGRLDVVLADTDVRELVADVVDAFAPQADQKGLDIAAISDPGVPTRVAADAGRLGQVLRNLVSNAVKFTERGSVLVEVERVDALLWISVTDTGRGMRAEDVERIFLPFEQVSAELVDRRAGTGLGLWIARSFVESWGGTITVESVPDRGTKFRVSLPITVTEAPQRFSTLMGMPVVIVVTQREATGRAFLMAGRDIDARVTTRRTLDEVLGEGPVEARALVVDTASTGLGALASLGSLKLGARLVLAAPASTVPEVEKVATALKARVMLLPPRATRLLPALETPHRALTHRPSQANVTVDATLLVVDDDAINRRVARHAAVQIGLRVLEAASGEEALKLLDREAVELVLLDLHLEGMSGDEVARRIRKLPQPPSIIAYTGSVQESDRRRLLEAGVEEILGKPLDRGAFVTATSRALNARRQQSRKTGRSMKLDILDLSVLDDLRVAMGGDGEIADMLQEYLPSLVARSERIALSAERDDWKTVGAEAHALSSAAATFGAQRAALIARTLERAVGTGEHGRIEGLVKALGEAVRETIPLLEQERDGAAARAALGSG